MVLVEDFSFKFHQGSLDQWIVAEGGFGSGVGSIRYSIKVLRKMRLLERFPLLFVETQDTA